MARNLGLALASAFAVALWGMPLAAPAQAAFPGQNGLIAYTSTAAGNSDIWVARPDGSEAQNLTAGAPGEDTSPAWSPDGRRIAFTTDRDFGKREIYTLELATGTLVRVTDSSADDTNPTWSPDGTAIAYVSDLEGSYDIWRIASAGGGSPARLTSNSSYDADPAWAPSGNLIAFASDRTGTFQIHTVDGSAQTSSAGESSVTRIVQNDVWSTFPNWSPDGSKIAFQRLVGSQFDIHTIPAAGGMETPVTSGTDDDQGVAWSPDGSRLALGRDATSRVFFDVFTMSASGGALSPVTNGGADSFASSEPDWQPTAPAPATSNPPAASPSATPAPQIGLGLDPQAASREAGITHTVRATVTRDGQPAAGESVRWSVAGPNARPAAVTSTGGDGSATLAWLGQSNGRDTLSVHVDLNADGLAQPGEPVGEATVDWRNGLPPSIPTAASIDDLPEPTPLRNTNVQAVGDGEIFVRLPAGSARASQDVSKGFIPLREAAQLPVGTVVAAEQGRARIEAAATLRGARTSTADFHAGRFRITQPRARNLVTEMVMQGGSFGACSRAKRSGVADAARRRRVVRRLWGSGRGRFRTRGRYSAATVRGTNWLVEDRCDGTLTRVRSGAVQVRDFSRGRNVVLRAGRSYLAVSRANLRKR